MPKTITVELEEPLSELLTMAARELSAVQSKQWTVEELAASYLACLLVDDANCVCCETRH